MANKAELPLKTVLDAGKERAGNEKKKAMLEPIYGAGTSTVLVRPEEKKPSGLNPGKLFLLVNEYRKKLRLSELVENKELCAIAKDRLSQLQEEIWGNKLMHSGFYNRNLSYYAVENLVANNTEEEAFWWWVNSPIHHMSMLADYKYSCTACIDGNCTQIFSNFESKIFAYR